MLKIIETHSMDYYMELLSSSLKIYIDEERLYNAIIDAGYRTSDLKSLVALNLKIESAGCYSSVSSDAIISFLLRIGVDEKYVSNRKTKGYSLDIKKVVQPLIDRGIAVELLTAYKEYRSFNSYTNWLTSLANTPAKRRMTYSGRQILEYDTVLEERENLRTYYSQIAVVSIPKLYSNMVTAMDDAHYIAWCDYPQADWRFAYNLFIKDEQNYKIMMQCEDAYEGLGRMALKDEFSVENFKEQRKDFKVHALSVYYYSRDTSPVPSVIRKFFASCPKYSRMLYDLKVLYHFKLPIMCKSYFGHEQLIPEGAYPDAFISKALNTPIQTFTSHVVNETVCNILETFWSLGYTKQDINVYYVRHDEPLFIFSRKILKDAWVFKEFSKIYIPGFNPIPLDFYFGRYYKEPDEFITNQINEAIASSNHEYYEPSEEELHQLPRDYNPYPTVEHVYVKLFEEMDGLRVVLYNYRDSSKKTIYTIAMQPEEAIKTAMSDSGLAWLGRPEYLLVSTMCFDFMDYIGENDCTLMKVVTRPDSGVIM